MTILTSAEEAAIRADAEDARTIGLSRGMTRRLLATLDAVRAAQEAPAPEGLRAALTEPDAHPFRWMLDGTPCWCVSADEPHEGWVHAPACQTLLRERLALALAATREPPCTDIECGDTSDHPAHPQEAPAPEGLRDAIERLPAWPVEPDGPGTGIVAYVPVDAVLALLAPPTPAEPRYRAETLAALEGMGRAKRTEYLDRIDALRAEARPPEGLDAAWAAAEAALPEGWRIDWLSLNPDDTWQVFVSSPDVLDAEVGSTPAAALLALAARLSAGGATKP